MADADSIPNCELPVQSSTDKWSQDPAYFIFTRIHGSEVVDFSSQYGTEQSYSYVASNLAGEINIFPQYGDFPQACVLRTYGPWWKFAPSAPKPYKRTVTDFISRDFIEVEFKESLFPAGIEVYETYNPGSIVRILACAGNNALAGKASWVTLWSGPPTTTNNSSSRIFSPTLKKVQFKTNKIRLEFNQDSHHYYSELDSIRLIGCRTVEDHVIAPSLRNFNAELVSGIEQFSISNEDNVAYLASLPEEVLEHIVDFLDIRDICQLAQTCSVFKKICYDLKWFTELDLKPFWTQVTWRTLDVLKRRCIKLERLNLSWCGKGSFIGSESVVSFLGNCKWTLKSLEMASCSFVDERLVFRVMQTCKQLTELNLQSCTQIEYFNAFRSFPGGNLKRLNLYRTRIDKLNLVALIEANPGLEHLNIGSCLKLNPDINEVLEELGNHCRGLKSIDLWRMKNLNHEGLYNLYQCPLLEEIDLGWCTGLKSLSLCFEFLAVNCVWLKKIYLTANRTVTDSDVYSFIRHCPLLEQFDILGTKEVTNGSLHCMLRECKNLKMVDISFCVGITKQDIKSWNEMFPHVDIKRSFQKDTA